MIRRAVFEDCGLYGDRFYLVEDLELWFRVAKKCQLPNMSEPLVSYRIWTGGLTTRKLWLLAWLSHVVRPRPVRKLGFSMSRCAYLYSVATLAAMLMPARMARAVFDKAVQVLGRGGKNSADAGNPVPALLEPQTLNPLHDL